MEKDKSKKQRIWIKITGVLLVTLLLYGIGYWYWAGVHYRFWTVTEGLVYRSGAMPPDDLIEKAQELGIKTIIDLRKPDDQAEIDAEHAAMKKLGVNHINLPSEQVPKDTTVKSFLSIMDDQSNRPVLIHCHHGEGRAVLFSAIYRMEYEGWENDRARRASRVILYGSSFSSDAKKGKYINNYRTRSKSIE